MIDPVQEAARLRAAHASRSIVAAPSSMDGGIDLPSAYAVEGEIVRARRAEGHRTAGLKVGFANKAVWRALKLETLVWAHMYDDTVHHAANGSASLSIAQMTSPKIEPEIVFKLKKPLAAADLDAAGALDAVEWLALGFEIIDCVFPDWKFQPADFVADRGLHAALVVGTPTLVTPETIAALVEALPAFKVRLMKNGELVEEGSGRNSLRSPALCLAELAAALTRQAGAETLAAGDLVSSGTLTTSFPIAASEGWRAEADGLAVAPLTLKSI